MTNADLIQKLKSLMGRQPIDELAYELVVDSFSIRELIDTCFHKNRQIGFHAAWVLESICINSFDYFLPAFSHFVNVFPNVNNPSVKRHFGKILLFTLKQFQKNNYKKQAQQFLGKPHEPLVATLFDWLIDPAVRSGVKVWCMDILEIFAKQYPWIEEELIPTVKLLLVDAGPGLQARGTKLLKRSAMS